MKRRSVILVALAAAVSLVASGCGGSSSVPPGDVAVVAGTAIPRSDLDGLVAQQKERYAATKQTFPKVGTSEYQSFQTQLVAYLVQVVELEQAAKDLGVAVMKKDVDKEFTAELTRKNPQGHRYYKNRGQLEKALKSQGWTDAAFRETLRVRALSRKVYNEVTKNVKVTSRDLQAYCAQSQSSCASTRAVRHILISYKKKNGKVDYAKSKTEADRIYAQLKSGADFATLAKRYSADPGTKNSGGKYTAVQGRDVPEFDRAAFSLKTGEISHPVASQYGFHVIQALGDVKKPALAPIRSSLLQQKKNAVSTQWVQDLQSRYKKKVKYAAGFEPPAIPTTSTATQ